MEHQIESNQKIRSNAISAYLMIFLSVFFLVNKENPLIANNFVKSHTKTAFLIHVLFLFTVLIFLWFDFWVQIQIIWLWLNQIIASSILMAIFWVLLYGIHKAHKGEYFTIWEILNFSKTDKLVWVSTHSHFEEKDKLALILSLVPFFGYIVYGHHSENEMIKNLSKFNLITSLFISIVYVSWNPNIWLFLWLIYIIFTVFTSIILIGKNELMSIDLSKIPEFHDLEKYFVTSFRYLKWFFTKKFTPYNDILEEVFTRWEKQNIADTKYIESLPEYKLPKLLIYLPIVNIFHIFYIKNKKYFHILNGISLSVLFILSWFFFGVDNGSQFLLLFPLFYWIGFLETNKTYKLPVIHKIASWWVKLWVTFKNIFSKTKELKNKKEEISLKPEKK